MTQVTGHNGEFTQAATGPTSGNPRTAASVNNGLQTPMDNCVSLSNGYARKTSINILAAVTTSNIASEYIFCIANGSAATQNQTLQFAPVVAINHYWKHVYLERVTQGTVLTFQGGAPYATFLMWTAPADMADVWLHFNHSSSSGTWTLMGVQWSRGNMMEIRALVDGTTAVTTTPREIRIAAYLGLALPVGTNRIDLDGDYKDGDRVTVFVRGNHGNATVEVRDSADALIVTSTMAQDGSDARIELVRNDGGWLLLEVAPSARLLGIEAAGSSPVANHSAGSLTLQMEWVHHNFGSVSSNMTVTIPDGTFIGQEVHLYFGFIAVGATVGINFTTYAGTSGGITASGLLQFQHFGAMWDGSHWLVTSRLG